MSVGESGKETLWKGSYVLTLFGMLFLFIPFSLYMPIMPVYMLEELHSSLQVAGAINGIFLLAVVLFRVQTARLEAQFGVRTVLLASGFMFMASNLLYIRAESVVSFMAIRFLSGACFAVVNTSVTALGSRLIPSPRMGEGLAYLTTTVLAGGAIGPYIGLKICYSYGYQAVFIFSLLSTLLGLLIVAAVPVQEEYRPVKPHFSFRELFEPSAVPVSLVVLLLAVAYGGVLTFIAVYATELHLPLVVEYFFVVMASTSVFSRLVTGRMFDRYGANVSIYLAITLLASGLLLLGLVHTVTSMLVSAALIGIGYGIAVPSFLTLAVQLSPKQRSSAVTATFFSCLDGGIGLGAYLLGGGIHAFGYAAVFLALGVSSVGCLVPYYFIYVRKQV